MSKRIPVKETKKIEKVIKSPIKQSDIIDNESFVSNPKTSRKSSVKRKKLDLTSFESLVDEEFPKIVNQKEYKDFLSGSLL